jgi:hypothetical protein
MDDGLRRDYRFNLGAVLFGVGFAGIITVGVAANTSDSLTLWPNPWFVVSLVATVLGAILIAMAWIGLRRKPEAGAALGGSVGLKGSLGFVVQRSDASVPPEEGSAQWSVECHPVSDGTSTSFGRGVVLSIRSVENETRHLRCVVQAPDGSRYENVKRRLVPSRARTEEEFHFPGEFRPKLQRPFPVGYYSYVWTGDTGDPADDTTEELARRFFHIDDAGTITCHKAVPRKRRPDGFPNWESGHDVKDGGVLLWMRSTDASELGLVKCRVQEPDGHIHRSYVRIPAPGESTTRGRWEFFYPSEFFEAPAEVWSGRYTVKWTAGGNDALVVRDEFDVP